MIRMRLIHNGETKIREVHEGHWGDMLDGNLDHKMKLAIGAWCDMQPGHIWPGVLLTPTVARDTTLIGDIGGAAPYKFFTVELLDVGGPW